MRAVAVNGTGGREMLNYVERKEATRYATMTNRMKT
jgi:hypothetical protein